VIFLSIGPLTAIVLVKSYGEDEDIFTTWAIARSNYENCRVTRMLQTSISQSMSLLSPVDVDGVFLSNHRLRIPVEYCAITEFSRSTGRLFLRYARWLVVVEMLFSTGMREPSSSQRFVSTFQQRPATKRSTLSLRSTVRRKLSACNG
jgi:hypothetical protein